MIITSDTLVLVAPGTGTGPSAPNADNPIVGWHNLLTTTGTVAADSEDPLYPASNLANPTTAELWVSLVSTAQNVTFSQAGDVVETDYVGIVRHNLGSEQIPVAVEGYIGGGWEEIVQEVLLSNDDTAMFRYTPGYYSDVRFAFGAGNAPPRVSIAYWGKLLVLPRRIYVGHTPINYGRSVEATTGVSQSGQFLGRIITNESFGTSFPQENIDRDWYRTYMVPFLEAATEFPFFFAWRPYTFPREVGYVWTLSPKPENQRNNGMMKIQIPINGFVR